MKIAEVRTYHLRSVLDQPFGFSQFYYTQRENLLVEVVTDDGTSGWGECYGPPSPIKSAIETCLANLVVGENVFDTELIWHKVWQRHLDHMRHGTIMAGLSGIDIALWDLKGRLLGLPVHRLLGGARTQRIPCYATGHYFRGSTDDQVITAILDEAEEHIRSGFQALKIKVGKNPEFDIKLIEAVRNRFAEIVLFADANHAYSLSEAVRIGRVLDANKYSFFEEPLAPHALEDFSLLRGKLDLAIATGECEQTRFGFRRLIECGGIDILQPDLAFCGGVSEGTKIRAMANAFGIDVTPHAWGTWIGFAAALHFHATAPPNPGRFEDELFFLECDNSENPVKSQVFSEPIVMESGFAVVPDKEGLGITVDKKALNRFLVT